MISLTKVGIANQRETTLAWKRSTGELLYDGIVWCDSRTSGIVDRLIKEHNGDVNSLKEKTGLPFATYFSAFKMRWMIENVEAVKQAYEAKDVMFGNVNTFMIYRLSGNKSFFTDASNASRMFLIDLKTVKYDQELLALFGLEENMLPEIKPNFADFGSLSLSGSEISGLSGIPILCSFGDQQSSAFGQNRLSVGETKVTFGTGCFMISNTGSEAITTSEGLLGTILYQEASGKVVYGVEASVECGGTTINWIRDSLKLFSSFSEMDALIDEVRSQKDNGGVFFVPCFAGLFSPYWKANAKSVLIGATNFTKPAHIVRACLEGIAYRVKDCLEALRQYVEPQGIVIDGGITNNQFFTEFLSACLEIANLSN